MNAMLQRTGYLSRVYNMMDGWMVATGTTCADNFRMQEMDTDHCVEHFV